MLSWAGVRDSSASRAPRPAERRSACLGHLRAGQDAQLIGQWRFNSDKTAAGEVDDDAGPGPSESPSVESLPEGASNVHLLGGRRNTRGERRRGRRRIAGRWIQSGRFSGGPGGKRPCGDTIAWWPRPDRTFSW